MFYCELSRNRLGEISNEILGCDVKRTIVEERSCGTMADGHASAADICERLRRLMSACVEIRTGARECARMFLIRMMLSIARASRGVPAGAVAALDEDNASLL